MKAYVIVTGAAFGLLTLAHIWRLTVEHNLATEPLFLIITVISAALAAWAVRLVWRAQQS